MTTTVQPSVVLDPTVPSGQLTCGPGSRWAWECPCRSQCCQAALDTCIEGTTLRKVVCSLPFIWIG